MFNNKVYAWWSRCDAGAVAGRAATGTMWVAERMARVEE